MNKWKTVPLGDICTRVCSGGTPKSNVEEYYNGDIPWLNTKEVDFNRIYETERSISQLGFDNSSAKWVEPDTIVVAMYGATAGKIGIIKNRMTTNQACCNLTINPLLADYNYVYFFLKTKYDYMLSLANGGAQQNLNAGIIKQLEIPLPELETQKRIARILSSLDDKIELNRKTNQNLEEQAKAIFKSWFVDFEPFQDCEFVDSELGRIPKGWEVGTLGDIIELHDHKRIPLSSRQRENMEKKYPYYGAASLMDYVDNYLFDGVYTLLGEDGTVVTDDGMPVLQYVWGKFWVNNHAHILTGKNGHSAETLYVLLKNTPVKSIVTGAVQPKISQANLKSIPIIITPQDIIQKYGALIEPFFEEIRRNSDESSRLVSIRDTLLPKLMSGEISLKEETYGK